MNVGANHLPEELIEKYAMENMSDWEGAPVEEHLLICQLCRTRLDKMDEFVALMKVALMDFSDTEPPAQLKRACVKTA
jgi:anti-sigma factor RsiW